DVHANDRPYDDGRVAARDTVKVGKQAADPHSRWPFRSSFFPGDRHARPGWGIGGREGFKAGFDNWIEFRLSLRRQVHRAFLIDCAPESVVRATSIQAGRYAKGVWGVGSLVEAMPLLSPPAVRRMPVSRVLTHEIAPVLPLREFHGAFAVGEFQPDRTIRIVAGGISHQRFDPQGPRRLEFQYPVVGPRRRRHRRAGRTVDDRGRNVPRPHIGPGYLRRKGWTIVTAHHGTTPRLSPRKARSNRARCHRGCGIRNLLW